ncbi:hypothetical protein LguiB_006621 [Lonicera macranthoides]
MFKLTTSLIEVAAGAGVLTAAATIGEPGKLPATVVSMWRLKNTTKIFSFYNVLFVVIVMSLIAVCLIVGVCSKKEIVLSIFNKCSIGLVCDKNGVFVF